MVGWWWTPEVAWTKGGFCCKGSSIYCPAVRCGLVVVVIVVVVVIGVVVVAMPRWARPVDRTKSCSSIDLVVGEKRCGYLVYTTRVEWG